jgi:hypothetical protein
MGWSVPMASANRGTLDTRPQRDALHFAFRHLLMLNQLIDNVGILYFNPVFVGHGNLGRDAVQLDVGPTGSCALSASQEWP